MRGLGPTSRQTQILIISTIALLSLLVTVFVVGRYEDSAPIPGSTYSPDPSGAKAAFMTLDSLGYSVDRWRLPAGRLPDGQTVIINAPAPPPAAADWRRLDGFAKTGGRVIVVGDDDLRIDGRVLWRHKNAGESGPLGVVAPTAYTRFIGREKFRSPDRVVSSVPGAVTHIGDKDGALLLSIKRGRGELIALADTDFFSNKALKEDPARIEVLVGIVGPPEKAAPVLFDEWFHGIRSVELEAGGLAGLPVRIWRVLPLWLRLLLIQAALVLAAWLYSDGKRLGPAVGFASEEDEDPLDYVTAMADLYRRAGAGRAALAAIYNRFIADVTGRRSVNFSSEGLAAKLVRSGTRDGEANEALVKRCALIISATAEPTEQELVTIANRLAVLRKEIRRHG